MVSEITILTTVGEILVQKMYRSDLPQGSQDTFLSHYKKDSNHSQPPHFKEGDVFYWYIQRQSVVFCAASKCSLSAVYVIELLSRVHQLCKDFCGAVTPESLRANFTLVHEVLDELMDCGIVQLASTEKLKPYIQSEPVSIRSDISPDAVTHGLFGIEHRTAPSDASNRPVIRSRFEQEMRKNEIFIDVIERLTAVLSTNGTVQRCEVSGEVNMKSFLIGSPDIKLGLNEDLTMGRQDSNKGYGHVVNLDSAQFHECVNMEEFEQSRILVIRPPEGEFSVMTYRLSGDLPHGLPFRLYSYINDSPHSSDIELGVKLRCELSHSAQAINVTAHIPVSKAATSISQQQGGPGQTAEFSTEKKQIQWTIKKILAKSEVSAHFKLIMASGGKGSRQDFGPIALSFEISGQACSNLQIRFLRVYDREHSYVPFRWVRYITVPDSYIFKVT